MQRAERLWHAVAGTRYRVLTSLVVLGYGLLACIVIAVLLFARRDAVYRISAVTEQFSVETTRTLRIGDTAVALPRCEMAALSLPPGSFIQGRRRSATAQTYIELQAPPGAKIEVACGRGQRLMLAAVTLPAPGPARDASGAPAPDAEAATTRNAFRISGRVSLGGQIDDATPTAAVALLRTARIVADVANWPAGALVTVSDRTIEGGGLLSFRAADGAPEPVAEGLLTMSPTAFELHLRFRGQGLLYTAPGAERGSEIVLAPDFLDRLKAQAQLGVWGILASLLLGLLEALRAFESASPRARGAVQGHGVEDVD